MSSFSPLNLKKELLEIVAILGYAEPTEVQKKVIPLIIQGKDVVFTSHTGSGKTLAFSLGVLGRLQKKHDIQMIVLVPTRELAIQVGKEMQKVADALLLNVGVLYGGRDIAGDYRTLSKKNHVIVATPGRLIQHINEKHIKVGEVKCVVFDESDQMFDQGFFADCTYLLSRVSKDTQIILSSATITKKVQDFIDQEIGDITILGIGTMIPANIRQESYIVGIKEKNALLLELFTRRKPKRTLVFCNTKSKVQSVSDFLEHHNFKAKPLSSSDDQQLRINRLNLFKEGKINILVATDVAARGIHIEKVHQVINYDVPTRTEFYVHRIGRTGRVDKKGKSVTFICPEDQERFNLITETYHLDIIPMNEFQE